jgi:nucleoid DNA-binding protein
LSRAPRLPRRPGNNAPPRRKDIRVMDAEKTPRRAGKPAKAKATPGTPVVKTVMAKTRASKSGVILKKKDLIDRAAEASGVRKADARGAIDAALALIGTALEAGDEVVLPPLGKLRAVMEKTNGKVRIMTLRLQVMTEGEDGQEPLAETGD